MSTKKTPPSEPSFEDSLRRLQLIVEKLEGGEASLDDALKLYEEGLALSKACMGKLNQAEVKLKRLAKDMEGSFRVIEEDRGGE